MSLISAFILLNRADHEIVAGLDGANSSECTDLTDFPRIDSSSSSSSKRASEASFVWAESAASLAES